MHNEQKNYVCNNYERKFGQKMKLLRHLLCSDSPRRSRRLRMQRVGADISVRTNSPPVCTRARHTFFIQKSPTFARDPSKTHTRIKKMAVNHIYRWRSDFNPDDPSVTITMKQWLHQQQQQQDTTSESNSDQTEQQQQQQQLSLADDLAMNPFFINNNKERPVILHLADKRFEWERLQKLINDPLACSFCHLVKRYVETPSWDAADMKRSLLSWVNDAKNTYYQQCQGYLITFDSVQIVSCKNAEQKQQSGEIRVIPVMEVLGNAYFMEIKKWNIYRGKIVELTESHLRVSLCNGEFMAKVDRIDPSIPGHAAINSALRVDQEIRFMCSQIDDIDPPYELYGYLLDILTPSGSSIFNV